MIARLFSEDIIILFCTFQTVPMGIGMSTLAGGIVQQKRCKARRFCLFNA